MPDLKPCPFCGGEIEERGAQCNYGKKIMTLDLMCKKCGTLFKFKSKWIEIPYREAVEYWNRRAGEEDDHSICGATNLPCIRCNPGGCDNRKEGADNG